MRLREKNQRRSPYCRQLTFINIAILLWAMNFERKKDESGRLAPLDANGWVDVGLVMCNEALSHISVDANVMFL